MSLSEIARVANAHASIERRVQALEAVIAQLPSRPTLGGSGSLGNAILDTDLTQTAHGFTVGSPVLWNGSSYVGAKADALSTAVYDGVVSKVKDADTFDLTYSGIISSPTPLAFTVGVNYVSDVAAGQVLAAAPGPTAYQIPVFQCLDDQTLLVFASSAVGTSAAAIHAGDPTSGGGTLRIYATADIYIDIDSSGILHVQNTAAGGNGFSIANDQLTASIGADVNVTITDDGEITLTNGTEIVSINGKTGELTLTQANGNIFQILAADFTAGAWTGKTIKMQAISVCDTGTGLIKQVLAPCSAAF